MRLYRPSAESEVRLEYGVELEEGLGFYEETREMVTALADQNKALEEKYEARRGAGRVKARRMARLRYAELNVETSCRKLSNTVQTFEGGRRGPIFEAIFPGGLTAVLTPAGTKQLAPVEALRTRVALRPGLKEATKAEWLALLDPSIADLKQAVEDYGTARKAWAEAFQAELIEREEHYLLIDKIMGQVRAAFPRDRRKQDSIFPTTTPTRRKPTEEETTPPVPVG